ncbi:hypothetical protein GCM10010363_47820 [Streptomyces omiyaensis]|uniref:hypothetical protein n=1 Tax=Streptomyces omiyaensis TaxID=68247 RepID=UPI0019A088B2|nr:hypothetical protein [Streptomyces omiyaensis]GGY60742.1 hypothetical protein GCM10010363_47820 [Streptomyces omiyaensis]
MAGGTHAMPTRHPWLGQAFGSHLLYGPGKSRFDDHGLALYERAGFAPADADRAAATVLVFVLGSALGAAAPDSTFDFGLRAVLDGFAATLAHRRDVP